MSVEVPDPWQALADPTRRHIFRRLTAHPSTATDLARDLPISRPAVSQHLRVLLESNLVEVHPQGRHRFYHPRPDGLSVIRNELETYWNQTLTRFKQVAEQTYQENTTSQKEKNHE